MSDLFLSLSSLNGKNLLSFRIALFRGTSGQKSKRKVTKHGGNSSLFLALSKRVILITVFLFFFQKQNKTMTTNKMTFVDTH